MSDKLNKGIYRINEESMMPFTNNGEQPVIIPSFSSIYDRITDEQLKQIHYNKYNKLIKSICTTKYLKRMKNTNILYQTRKRLGRVK